MADDATSRDRVALLLRAEVPGVRARLIGALRDFDLAEDALQDALLKAWERWPADGAPDHPAAWLFTVARRRAFDVLRHERVTRGGAGGSVHTAAADESVETAELSSQPEDTLARADFDDDLLRLIFTCCHPVLRPEARAALTLKTVLDLDLEEVARAFLVEPRTMEQRLVRAKRRIRDAGVPWAVPSGGELTVRLDDVLRVAYLIFTEGYAATGGDGLIRPALCALAIALTRRLNRLLRGHAEALALLALMLLQHARSRGRTDTDGHLVLLEDQDRTSWNAAEIREGTVLLEKALHLRQAPGTYQIQAAIAAIHANAPSAKDTDWQEITALYDALRRVADTPVVRLNRAVAVAMARGAAAGLAELSRLSSIPSLRGYHPFHTARGALLWRLGEAEAALDAYRRALGLARNAPERAFLRSQIESIEQARSGVSGRAPGTPPSC